MAANNGTSTQTSEQQRLEAMLRNLELEDKAHNHVNGEFLTSGAVLACQYGVKKQFLGSSSLKYTKIGNEEVLIDRDVLNENNESTGGTFGVCKSPKFDGLSMTKTIDISVSESLDGIAKKEGGHTCYMQLAQKWSSLSKEIVVYDPSTQEYREIPTTNSYILCYYGQGCVYPIDSGQRVTVNNTEGSGYVELTISPKGENFTTLCEGHDEILANGNYAVIDTNDGKLTTYGGLTIAEQINGIWVPINGFTQSQVNNWTNGVSPTVWRTNYDTYRNRSATAINKFASDNGLKFTQYEFDALMDFGWTNGNVINSQESNGTYTYDFVNIMLESGFLTNPTTSQIDKFESAFGNLVSMGGIRTSGFWVRRMSQLSVFWGEADSNGDYIRKDYGNTQQTKIAADAWLTSRGLNPTAR